ncbi:MAG: hypothetical protein LBR56_04370 [Sporomusaceae bacterium]|nr:hypothetical protein [Sporomusaceae bacterium]
MDIMEQAIQKLDTELETATGEKAYLYAINQIVRALLLEGDDYAEKVLADKHTLENAYKTMQHIAATNRQGDNCVCIAPDEAQDIIGRFYRFWGEPFDFDPDEKPKSTVIPSTPTSPVIRPNKYSSFKKNNPNKKQINLFGEEE